MTIASSLEMASNGKRAVRSDELKELLSSAVTNHDSAEVALLYLMREYDFDVNTLRQTLADGRINLSFSKVKYPLIASFVGLEAHRRLTDIQTFELCRSRIPTELFRSIVQDIDIMQVQYGPPIEHETEQARSRFLSPVFNRIVAVFDFALRNLPESFLEGRMTTKSRVEYYFRAIQSIAVLFVEFKYEIGGASERLDAIAQMIAECDAVDWNNAHDGVRVPVYGILCDGDVFEFFRFDGSTNPPSFNHGCYGPTSRTRLVLPDFTDTVTCPFIDALRPICEIIFDMMLRGYVSSLEVYHNRSQQKSVKEGKPRSSRDKWEQAITHAGVAQTLFRNAETKRQAGLLAEANTTVEEAIKTLTLRHSSPLSVHTTSVH